MVKSLTVQNWAMAWIALWAISPPLFMDLAARALTVIMVAVWFAVEAMRSEGILRKPTMPIVLSLVYLGYTSAMMLADQGLSALNRELQVMIMLMFMIFAESRRKQLETMAPILWVVLIALPVWMAITINTLLTQDAHAARTVVRASIEAEAYTAQGVGGYALVYGSVLLLPALLVFMERNTPMDCLFLNRPSLFRVLTLLNIALTVVLVLLAGYTIAASILFAIFVARLTVKFNSARGLILRLLCLPILIIVAVPLVLWGLESLLPLAAQTSFERKIVDLISSIAMGEVTGTAEVRYERYMRSLDLFLDNLLLGVWSFDNLGKHSSVLDSYAQWGVLFGTIFLYLLVLPAVRAFFANPWKPQLYLVLCLPLVGVFVLNNEFAAAGVIIYLITPLASLVGAKMTGGRFSRQGVRSA